jgi:hypothetical protein
MDEQASEGVALYLADKNAARFFLAANLDINESGGAFPGNDMLQLVRIALQRQRFHTVSEEVRRSLTIPAQEAGLLTQDVSFAEL